MKPPFINCLFKDIETNGGGSVMVSHNNCLAYFENCDFVDNWSNLGFHLFNSKGKRFE